MSEPPPASDATEQGPRVSFQRLRELFDGLLDLPADERDAAISRCTPGDPRLAAELRSLLAAEQRLGTPLDAAALRLPAADEVLPEVPGFTIRRRLGRGGSSTVYLAEQEHAAFRRDIALKVVDQVVDPESLRRVRDEQRILARLEHPGIARLYDAGVTPLGQPWLAMEWVEGETILEHCRSRDLPVRERLQLFLAVLDAVGFAHGQGVVHRDLKPANVLVSGRGEAKLLDFGIAKLMAAPTAEGSDEETRTARRAMTPAYASPEQVRGDRVAASSDVYSLGVVLYQLLADTLPYRLDGKRYETVEDAIRAQDPEPPSDAFSRTAAAAASATTSDQRARSERARRRRALRGDLDAIVLKALRKEPQARYAGVADMAADLRRYLVGEPVAARRGTWRYRARKALRRHRAAVSTAAGVVALLGGLAAIPQVRVWWLAGDDPLGAEVARFHRVRGVDAETRRLLREGADRLSRHDPLGARERFLAATVRSPAVALGWDGLARAEGALGEPGRAAAAAQHAAEDVADLPGDEGELVRARALAARYDWEAAVPALEGLFGRLPNRIDIGLDLVGTLLAAGRGDEADNALGRLRQLHAGPLVGQEGAGNDPRIALADAEVALRLSEFQRAAAAAAAARARAAELGAAPLGLRAERLHAEAIMRLDRRDEARRDLEALLPRDLAAGLVGEAAVTRVAIGVILLRVAGNDEAQAVLTEALAGVRAAGARPAEVVALVQLSLLAGKRGEHSVALRLSDEALAVARHIRDRASEGFTLSQRLVLLNWADDEAGAMAIAEPTLAALRESGNRLTLLSTLTNLALSRVEHLELEQAAAHLDEAEALGRRVGSQSAAAKVLRARGYLQQTRGDLDLARQSYDAGLAKSRRAAVPSEVGEFLWHLAWLELEADRPDAAERAADEAIEVFTQVGNPRSVASVEPVLAWVDARHGDAASARRRLAALRKAAAEGSGASEFVLLSGEARVDEALGDWQHALQLRQRTIALAREWESAGLLMDQSVGLARALHATGDREGLERLVAELLPQAEELGLRGVERELRALVAAPAG